jgi:hypothetical protein
MAGALAGFGFLSNSGTLSRCGFLDSFGARSLNNFTPPCGD